MKRRLLLSYLSITAFVLLVLEIPLGVSYANSVERRLTSDLQHDAFAMAIQSQQPLDGAGTATAATATPAAPAVADSATGTAPATNPVTSADIAALQALADRYQRRAGGRVVIVDRAGTSVADSDHTSPIGRDFSSRPEIARALAGQEVSGTRTSQTLGTDLLYVALPVASATGVQGVVRITYPQSVVDGRIRHIWLLLLATGGVVLGIVFLVSLLLARSMTKPLGDLQQAAVHLGAGDLATRAEVPRGPPEVTVLAQSFNATAARLEQLVGSQRAFIADASHQLRTPLAALRLRLECLEPEVPESIADDLDGALDEVARLSRLVDGLLVLARAEQSPSTPGAVPLEDVIDGRCEAWDAFAAEKQVRVVADLRGTPVAAATAGRLEQVVDNLLNNALEVAPPHSTVRISGQDRGVWVELRISDEGPGMTRDQRERAFDRFWQSGEARKDGRPNGHFGLGLAIVRELVLSDGGDVALEEAESGGLEVVVRLRPAPRPPAKARQLSAAATG